MHTQCRDSIAPLGYARTARLFEMSDGDSDSLAQVTEDVLSEVEHQVPSVMQPANHWQ
jgi:hypothetical protein